MHKNNFNKKKWNKEILKLSYINNNSKNKKIKFMIYNNKI